MNLGRDSLCRSSSVLGCVAPALPSALQAECQHCKDTYPVPMCVSLTTHYFGTTDAISPLSTGTLQLKLAVPEINVMHRNPIRHPSCYVFEGKEVSVI
jgi:hypothetical protein